MERVRDIARASDPTGTRSRDRTGERALESNALGLIILNCLRLIGWTYYVLPRPLRDFAVSATGIGLRVLKPRSRVAEENLRTAFPENSPESRTFKKTVYRRSYDHLARLV